MILSEPQEKTFRRLFDHYARTDEERGRQVKSGQSGLEHDLEARQKMGRHLPRLVLSGVPGDRRRILWLDNGIRCGPVFVGHGDEFPEQPSTFRTRDTPQLSRPDAVATALRTLDAETNHRLELLARDPLPRWRVPFGRPFKAEGGERFRAPTLGIMREPSRGPGNLGHLTDAAQARWGTFAARALDQLGRRLHHVDEAGNDLPGRCAATEEERAFARMVEPQACRLALACLEALQRSMGATDRLPTAVRRAGAA